MLRFIHIRLSWSFGGQRFQTTLGFSVKKTDWDEENKLVKPNTQNHNGQSADDINFFIKRIGLVVAGIEQHFVGNEKALTKDTIKPAIKEALSLDFARPEDIIERRIEGWGAVVDKNIAEYYKDLAGRYYKFLCKARHILPAGGSFYILLELFGRGERIAVPIDRFNPQKENRSSTTLPSFQDVSSEEVFGR